jgi:uncharacterized protein (UPF0335 family)
MADGSADVQGIAAAQLRSIVERIERLEGEIKDLNADKADVYAEAKGNGYSVKALKIVVRQRAIDPAERQETEAMVDLYRSSLGMA